jgi:Tetratricopeptide repeat
LALAEYKANHFDKAAEQAGLAYEQAMQMRQQATGEAIKAAHLEGDAYNVVAKYELALAAYRKAAALLDKSEQPLLWAKEQNMVARMLNKLARYRDAESIYKEILAIREQQLGANHTDTAVVLNNLALLLQDTNRLGEAEPLMRRALAITEASFGSDHPKVAIRLNNLAQLLQATNRLSEAEPLMRRTLAIDEASFGSDHPDVARDLNNLALLLQATNRLGEAEPLMRRAVLIVLQFTQNTGHKHQHLLLFVNNYQDLLTEMQLSKTDINQRLQTLANEAGFSPQQWQALQAQWQEK